MKLFTHCIRFISQRRVPADDGDEDGLEILRFHLEAPGRRPSARRSGGRVGAHPPPHPGRGKRVSRELRDRRILIYRLRRGEGVRVVNLDRVARRATDIRPVEGDARTGAEARVRRGTDKRGRWQRAGGRRAGRRRRDGQRRRAAYASVGRGDADAGVGGHCRGGDGEGHA